jgi:hypothetical protein
MVLSATCARHHQRLLMWCPLFPLADDVPPTSGEAELVVRLAAPPACRPHAPGRGAGDRPAARQGTRTPRPVRVPCRPHRLHHSLSRGCWVGVGWGWVGGGNASRVSKCGGTCCGPPFAPWTPCPRFRRPSQCPGVCATVDHGIQLPPLPTFPPLLPGAVSPLNAPHPRWAAYCRMVAAVAAVGAAAALCRPVRTRR